MTWCVIKDGLGGTAVQLDVFCGRGDTIVSSHDSYRDAGAALAELRAKLDREAALEAGQRDLFAEGAE